MKKLVTGILGLTTILWLLGLWLQPPAHNMRAIMHEVYYLNGLWAWTLMALAVITAARPAWMLALVKSDTASLFAWHKGLGIAAAALSVVHWFSRPLFASMLSFLATEPVQRFARQPAQGLLDAAWGALRAFAIPSSIAATAAVVVLCVLALIPALRSPLSMKLHRLFSLIYLVLAVHCVRLMETGDWMTPFGWLNLAVTAVGAWYAVRLMARRISGATGRKESRAIASRQA
jgi:predicted ferric reductase